MTPIEVRSALKDNVGQTVLVTPRWRDGEAAGPELVFVVSLNDEGFTYRILSDPGLYDPEVRHWMDFVDIANVQPATP
jgi:hypothetical protein